MQTYAGRELIRQAFADYARVLARRAGRKAGVAVRAAGGTKSMAGRAAVNAEQLAGLVPATTEFRLYVDGDFADVGQVAFWQGLLKANKWLNAYGYSKSFKELLDYSGTLAPNYTLNISSGHAHDSLTVSRVEARLAATRGHFIAVTTPTKWRQADYGSRAYNAELVATHKANTGRKAFPCPGKCGECRTVKGKNSHACGDKALTGVDIIIAMH